MSERVIALQGAASFVVQNRLSAFARARVSEGVRVAGCVEEFSGAPSNGCAGRTLRDLVTGETFLIGQDLGPGSLACHLDAAGVTEACRRTLDAIEAGCDLVVLAKFGKLEASRGGLLDAFASAVERDLPIVTSVAPAFTDSWLSYSGELAKIVDARPETLDLWWRAQPEGRPLPVRSAG